jgi:hypothetical protein
MSPRFLIPKQDRLGPSEGHKRPLHPGNLKSHDYRGYSIGGLGSNFRARSQGADSSQFNSYRVLRHGRFESYGEHTTC